MQISRKYLTTMAGCFCGGVFFSLILEVVLGIFHPGLKYSTVKFIRNSDKLPRIGLKNYKGRMYSLSKEYDVEVRLNSNGFRGKELNLDSKLLFVGGSNTFGHGVKENLVFSSLVSQKKQLDHINLGMEAIKFDTTAPYLHYAFKELKVEPKYLFWVIFSFGLDSFINKNLAKKEKRNPASAPQEDQKKYIGRLIQETKEFLKTNSNVYNYIVLKIKSSPTINKALIKVRLIKNVHDVKNDIYAYMPGHPKSIKLYKNLKLFISQNIKTYREKTRLVIIFIPNSNQISKKQGLKYLKNFPVTKEDVDFDYPAKKIVQICRELKILCVNPTDEFRASKESPFFIYDGHINITGHKIVADSVIELMDKYERN